jgi:hypothetical protein
MLHASTGPYVEVSKLLYGRARGEKVAEGDVLHE